MRIISLFIIGLYSLKSQAQTLHHTLNHPYLTTKAYSKDQTDIFSFTANQAAISGLKNPGVGVYSERRFMLQDVSHYMVAAAVPTTSGNFGFQLQYFGSSNYNETKIGLTYGRKLGEKATAGIQFNYQGIKIGEGYGTSAAITAEAGIIVHVTEKLHTGIQVTNLARGKFGIEKDESLSSAYIFGLGYEASEKFLCTITMEKEEDLPLTVDAGLQYNFVDKLFARAGISTTTSACWFGVGMQLKSYRIDIMSSWHPLLGISPGLLLLWEFKKSAK